MSIVSVSRRAGPPHFGQVVFDPVLDRRQRALALRRVVLDLGELDRELVVGHRHHAAVVAVDDRDRAAPVALAGEQPVAQAVVDRGLAELALAPARRRSPVGLAVDAEPSNSPLLTSDLVVGVAEERLVGPARRRRAARRPGGSARPKAVAKSKSRSSWAGHGHQRAGAVLHQHVVGDEHRDLLAVDRVGDRAAERDAGLRALLVAALLGRLADRLVDVGAHLVLVLGAGGEPLDLGVLGGEDEEGGAEEGVGAGGEDREVDARAPRSGR